MADPTYERERTDWSDLRSGSAGRTDRLESEVARGNPDLIRDGHGDARDRSIGSLLKELRDESTTLIRQEIALAKTEMAEKAGMIGRNVASIGVGAATLYAGVMVLLFGLTFIVYFGLNAIGLSNFWSGVLSFIGMGALIALVGYGLIQKGLKTLKHESAVPEKTIESLKEDKQWVINRMK